MARISVSNRNKKRERLVESKRAIREELKAKIINQNLNNDERRAAMLKLQSLPRDSSPSRRRHRCKICDRPRAYNRLSGLCRLHLRIATLAGMVPGMHKASW